MKGQGVVVLAGLFDLALAAFHLAFWRLFGWPARLRSLDSVNRALPPVMNIALIVLFTLLGIAFLAAPAEALGTRFGRLVLAGMALFWLIRAVVQIPYFGLRHPVSKALFAAFLCGWVLHGACFLLDARGTVLLGRASYENGAFSKDALSGFLFRAAYDFRRGSELNGSSTETPVGSKSEMLRVTTVRPRSSAVAAI